MAKNHGNQIKDDAQYEKLREKGMSKEKAAPYRKFTKAGNWQKGRESLQI